MTTVTPETLTCPQCRADLVEVERAGLMVDICPTCRGTWLDRGELERILVAARRADDGEIDLELLAELRGRRRDAQGTGPAQRSARLHLLRGSTLSLRDESMVLDLA